MTDLDDPFGISEDEIPAETAPFTVRDISEDEVPAQTAAFAVTPAASGGGAAAPAAASAISEFVTPIDEPWFREKPRRPTHDQITRRGLALVVLIPTVVFYAFVLLALVCHWVDRDDLTALVAAISPFQALAAAVVGFYFAKRDD